MELLLLGMMMITVILSGGSGARLWPLSRDLYPKPFIPLINNRSLFHHTVIRNAPLSAQFMVVLNRNHLLYAKETFSQQNLPVTYLLESVGRNTAPAIALAALSVDPDQMLLITPSDHLITDQKGYEKVIQRAQELARQNYLVTFGITPYHPETGYGYIEADGENVTQFHEKPDLNRAKEYIKSGNFYWNSGIFCFKASTFLNELKKYAPEIYHTAKTAIDQTQTGTEITITQKLMEMIPANSIDYAVMEQSDCVKVVPSDIGWNDLGNFESLTPHLNRNHNLIEINGRNNTLTGDDRQVVLVDVDDLIVVDTPDALLVSKRGSSHNVKEAVTLLKNINPELIKAHTTVHRPWGTYTILENRSCYKVKRVVINPGHRISLQKHFKRSELWQIITGNGVVTLNEHNDLVKAGESVSIPVESPHRLQNSGTEPLILIEIQTGTYFGEDDIVRLSDDYNRV